MYKIVKNKVGVSRLYGCIILPGLIKALGWGNKVFDGNQFWWNFLQSFELLLQTFLHHYLSARVHLLLLLGFCSVEYKKHFYPFITVKHPYKHILKIFKTLSLSIELYVFFKKFLLLIKTVSILSILLFCEILLQFQVTVFYVNIL